MSSKIEWRTPAALATWKAEHGLTRSVIADALGISGPAVSQRTGGRTRTTVGDVFTLRHLGDGKTWQALLAAAIKDALVDDGADVDDKGAWGETVAAVAG